ncbi:MAG: hydroxyacid dehydrogenase [Peptococcaceae bacterium]|jgi:phosphoglycerate dehydrogenase-like enzyme|nr:hydroxyacid dehydrogenase [Peptococcaceae bacterium]
MRIVLAEPLGIAPEILRKLSQSLAGHDFVAFDSRPADETDLVSRVKDADVAIIANYPFSNDAIAQCPSLKMLSVAFTGTDHVGLDACRAQNIAVSNAAGYSTFAVAELTFGFMIGLSRFMLPCDAATRASQNKGNMIGTELKGKTLGVIGTGAIGLRVAELGKALGMDVIAYSRSEKQAALNMGVRYVSLDQLMATSDFVSVNCPLNNDTKGLIGKEAIAKMKPTACLINTARGPVVDSQALADALNSDAIRGAGIDVFEMEPPVPADHPLLHAKNTILAPHVGFATKEALVTRAEIAFDNITTWLKGERINQIL